MGRRPAPWLQQAYDILADGQWHLRDAVVREMVKLVPPGVAFRRGRVVMREPDRLSRRVTLDAGARHICHTSLRDSEYVTEARTAGAILIRRQEGKAPVLPMVFVPSDAGGATHVLVDIDDFRALGVDAGEFVRRQWIRAVGVRRAPGVLSAHGRANGR